MEGGLRKGLSKFQSHLTEPQGKLKYLNSIENVACNVMEGGLRKGLSKFQSHLTEPQGKLKVSQ